MASVRDLILQVTERKSGNALVEAARELDGMSRGVDATDASMKKMESDAKRLQTEIEKTNARIKDLRKQVAATGDESLFGDIRKEEARARNLTKTLSGLFDDGGKQAGNSFTRAFSSAVDAGAEGVKPMHALIAALIGFVVAAAPAIGAAVAGAVTGVAAIAGIAGGIFAASKDPSVRSAAQEFGSKISAEFFSSGTSFVEPIRESLAILAADFGKLNLASTFAKVAPYVTTLASGIGELALNFMPGFNKALDRAGPYIDVMASGFAEMGASLGDFLDNVSRSHGSLEGLEALFGAINATIVGTGNILHWLSDRFHDLNKTVAWVMGEIGKDKGFAISGWFQDWSDKINAFADKDAPHAVQAAGALGSAMGGAATHTEDLAKAINSAEQALERYNSTASAVVHADIAVAQGFADLQTDLIKGKDNWDNSTQAGRHNNEMIQDQIDRIEAARQAHIREGMSVDEANKKFDEQLAVILAIAAGAGEATSKIEALAKTWYIRVVTVEERQVANQLNKAAAVDKAMQGFASGGDTPAFAPFRVHDGEVLFSDRSHYVATKSQVDQMSGGGSGALQIQVGGAPSGPLEAMFVEWLMTALRGAIRGQGGELAVLGLKAP